MKKFKRGVDTPFESVLIYTSRRKTGSTLKTEQREAKEAWSLRRAGKKAKTRFG